MYILQYGSCSMANALSSSSSLSSGSTDLTTSSVTAALAFASVQEQQTV
jgi:hypothetical protein